MIDNERIVHFTHDLTNQPRLTPIPEGTVLPGLSITTVEATATAKIFLEAHFNTFLNGADTREIRKAGLQSRVMELRLPAHLQDRAMTAWARKRE